MTRKPYEAPKLILGPNLPRHVRQAPIDLGDGTSAILLTRGKLAIIDTADRGLVEGRSWYSTKKKQCWYAKSDLGPVDGERVRDTLHRVIMGVTDRRVQVDHINRNGLDNRRSNMRLCSNAENSRNQRRPSNTSGFKGVSWNKLMNKWRAQIRVDYHTTCIGHFASKEDAARAYDQYAMTLFGEFAVLNFP